MKYDMTDYRNEALATEAPITPEVKQRVVRCYDILKEYMQECQHDGQILNQLKAFAFYGKPCSEIEEQLSPLYPTGAKRERIEQCVQLLHGIIGIMAEMPEILEAILKYLEEDKPLDMVNLREEVGDFLWFANLIAVFSGSNLVEIAERNIAKLKQRHPSKFQLLTHDNRDLGKERQVLEG